MRWLVVCLAAPLAGAVEFNRDVRPILSDKCFLCHGADAKTKNIPLRLDQEEFAKARVIVPGKPEESELIRRITAEQAGRRMPPVHTGLKLSEAEIATLRAWIAEGAKWEKHWSFLPPKRVEAAAGQNAIDYFVRQRLAREGLTPSPEASRETLLRRVTLDLTGLPPTPAEVQGFVNDRSTGAYEKVVDRLLGSPRYGERMAARWLDAARYADTNGYQFDGERVMWRWRDWVIDAYNRNQPYNQFVLEQIAGDMLPGATLAQKIATGFNRNHRGNTEDGIIPEEYAVEYVVDRVETVSTVFMGLTLGCTRCHNHKYDPFTQQEFYQLFAYFNNVPENGRAMKYGNSPPLVAAPTPAQQARLAEIEGKIAAAETALERDRAAIAREEEAWGRTNSGPVSWHPLTGLDTRVEHAGAFDGKRLEELKGKAQFDIDDAFTLSAWVEGDGAVMSRMKDQAEGKGFGLYLDQGKVHFHITSNYESDALRMTSSDSLSAGARHHLAVAYDGSVTSAGVRVYADGRPLRMNVEMETLYRPFRNAGRKYTETFRVGAGGGPGRRFKGSIGEVLVYSRALSEDEVRGMALGEKDPRVRHWYFMDNVSGNEDWKRMQALRLEKDRFERTFPTSMVMAESPVKKDTFFLIRGAYDKKGEKVEPGVPAQLPALPAGAPNNRLGFAKWLIDPANPLTARVAVNRFWQMYFGTGLVKTVEDFGSQGEWPSHPELLDWLATEFVRTGWDVKRMQKLIVLSATYRQSSKATAELLQRDPDNRLMARGPRYRMPAEMIRDQALSAAGLLSETVGGPSVKPYQPDGLWNDLAMQDMYYTQSKGPDLYRRSLYTFWKRTIAPPMMMNFDAANREACVVRENRTNTPLQALNLMNDVTFLEAARFVGQRMMKEGGASVEERLRYGFLLALGRWPAAAELGVARDSFHYHLDYFADDARAKKYLESGDTRTDAALNARELAAHASVASLLMNLDEAVTKE